MISEELAKQNYTRTGKYYIDLRILAKEKQTICYIYVQKPFKFCLRLSDDKYKPQNNKIRL